MNSNMDWLPDLEEYLRRRYRLLKYIESMANVGRKRISKHLGMPYSQIAKDTAMFCLMGYMVASQGGFSVTPNGRASISRFEKENPERVLCMKLEDRFREILSGIDVFIYDTMYQVEVVSDKQPGEPLAIQDWKQAAEELDPQQRSFLAMKDACVQAGEMILSGRGKPLYRIGKNRIPEDVWFRSQDGVQPQMLYAAMRYYMPKTMILYLEDAKALYEIYMKEREHNAGSCD